MSQALWCRLGFISIRVHLWFNLLPMIVRFSFDDLPAATWLAVETKGGANPPVCEARHGALPREVSRRRTIPFIPHAIIGPL